MQLGGEFIRDVGRGGRFLSKGAANPEDLRRSIGLEVHTCNELVTQQERQDVVAVDPLRRGHVDLDAIPEPEDPLGAIPVPDQRVER